MTLVQDFAYFKPGKLAKALALKTEYGSRGRFLAGGTDLINNLADEVVSPEAVIDLKGIADLKRLEFSRGRLRIGALVTFSDLIGSATVKRRFPLLWEAAGEVASISVRNRATLVGNLCSCVPCLDSGPPLVLYEATVEIAGSEVAREMSIFDFLQGPRKTALQPEEMVTAVTFPDLPRERGESFVKLKRYRGEDLAQASVGVIALPGNRYRVAFGSVNPVPVRAAAIEAVLKGGSLTPKRMEAALDLVAKVVAPLTDIRASREYRLHMCRVMLERALKAADERRRGRGPKYGTSLI
ncbi:MAG TPA: xanthine dehydrogenase family protein subunit M [bacterium]|nr:xanthine dehydrogenase family protein subunit M [bacterium]HPJ72835.1 xanthine dehydrogenase family protein subunit M [bacterium]HPQ66775.1 xanthine dehydrogenase family protein subunit M [bacterium]